MQKLCCVRTRQQFSASLVYLVTSLPPYLHQFSTISGGNCIISKSHHFSSYHRVREAIAAKYISFHCKDGKRNPADILRKHWEFATVWPMLKPILFWRGETATQLKGSDRIPSTNPGAEPPRDARDSGSARSHFNAPRN